MLDNYCLVNDHAERSDDTYTVMTIYIYDILKLGSQLCSAANVKLRRSKSGCAAFKQLMPLTVKTHVSEIQHLIDLHIAKAEWFTSWGIQLKYRVVRNKT